METSDWIALGGVGVAVLAISSPLIATFAVNERRFRSGVRYQLERFGNSSRLTFEQVVDRESSAAGPLTAKALSADLHKELVRVLRDDTMNFVAALPQSAQQIERRISKAENDVNSAEMWHALIVSLQIAVGRDLSERSALLGAAAQAMGTAHIVLLFLKLSRDEGNSLDYVAAVVGPPPTADPLQRRMRLLASNLLPPPTMSLIDERTSK